MVFSLKRKHHFDHFSAPLGDPFSLPKSTREKRSQKNITNPTFLFFLRFGVHFGLLWGGRGGPTNHPSAHFFVSGALGGPRFAPRAPMTPKWSQMSPKLPKIHPKLPQNDSKMHPKSIYSLKKSMEN